MHLFSLNFCGFARKRTISLFSVCFSVKLGVSLNTDTYCCTMPYSTGTNPSQISADDDFFPCCTFPSAENNDVLKNSGFSKPDREEMPFISNQDCGRMKE